MKWQKISDYCISADGYKIAKCTVMGNDLFMLSIGGETHGIYDDSAKAKRVAEEHSKEKAA